MALALPPQFEEAVEGRLQDLGKELTCPVCLRLLCAPVSKLNCEHYFCGDCLKSAMSHKNRCPVCKEPATRRAVARDERIERIVNIYAGLVADVGLNIYCSQLPPRNEGFFEAAGGAQAPHSLITPGPGEAIPHSQAARNRGSLSTGRASAGAKATPLTAAATTTAKRRGKGKGASGAPVDDAAGEKPTDAAAATAAAAGPEAAEGRKRKSRAGAAAGAAASAGRGRKGRVEAADLFASPAGAAGAAEPSAAAAAAPEAMDDEPAPPPSSRPAFFWMSGGDDEEGAERTDDDDGGHGYDDYDGGVQETPSHVDAFAVPVMHGAHDIRMVVSRPSDEAAAAELEREVSSEGKNEGGKEKGVAAAGRASKRLRTAAGAAEKKAAGESSPAAQKGKGRGKAAATAAVEEKEAENEAEKPARKGKNGAAAAAAAASQPDAAAADGKKKAAGAKAKAGASAPAPAAAAAAAAAADAAPSQPAAQAPAAHSTPGPRGGAALCADPDSAEKPTEDALIGSQGPRRPVRAIRTEWACPQCTLINAAKRTKCQACRLARPPVVAKDELFEKDDGRSPGAARALKSPGAARSSQKPRSAAKPEASPAAAKPSPAPAAAKKQAEKQAEEEEAEAPVARASQGKPRGRAAAQRALEPKAAEAAPQEPRAEAAAPVAAAAAPVPAAAAAPVPAAAAAAAAAAPEAPAASAKEKVQDKEKENKAAAHTTAAPTPAPKAKGGARAEAPAKAAAAAAAEVAAAPAAMEVEAAVPPPAAPSSQQGGSRKRPSSQPDEQPEAKKKQAVSPPEKGTVGSQPAAGAAADASTPKVGKWKTPNGGDMVFTSSGLNAQQKGDLNKLAQAAGGKMAENWSEEVTHVVVGGSSLFVRDGVRRSKRTMKYMQGVQSGQWVVAFDWVSACLAARRRVEEESFEIDGDTQGGNGGPKAGRLRKQSGGPPLFHGLEFALLGEFVTIGQDEVSRLIAIAGGEVVRLRSAKLGPNLRLVCDGDAEKLAPKQALRDLAKDGAHLPAKAQVLSHLWVLDCVGNGALLPVDKFATLRE